MRKQSNKEQKAFIYIPETYFNIIDGLLWTIAGLIGMFKFNDGSIAFNFIASCVICCLGTIQWLTYFYRPAKYTKTVQICRKIDDILNANLNTDITFEFVYDDEEKIMLRKNVYYNVFNWYLNQKIKCVEIHSKKSKK